MPTEEEKRQLENFLSVLVLAHRKLSAGNASDQAYAGKIDKLWAALEKGAPGLRVKAENATVGCGKGLSKTSLDLLKMRLDG